MRIDGFTFIVLLMAFAGWTISWWAVGGIILLALVAFLVWCVLTALHQALRAAGRGIRRGLLSLRGRSIA